MNCKRRNFVLVCSLLLLMASFTFWRFQRELARQQRNQALIEAIKTRHTSIALFQLRNGADPNTCEIINLKPAKQSLWDSMQESFAGLFDNHSRSSRPGFSALMLAVQHNNAPEVIKALLAHGATNLDALIMVQPESETDGFFDSPLLAAAIYKQNFDAAQALMDKGADVNRKNERLETPLMLAVSADNLPLIRSLLAKGAKVNTWNNNGETPLLFAVEQETVDPALVRVLLENGANPNFADIQGITPLMQTANPKIMQILLEKGASVQARSTGGGSMGMTPLLWQAYLADVREVRQRPDVDAEQEFRRTLNKQCIELLLRHGANIKEKDANGYTALMSLAPEGTKNEITFLLKKGAQVNVSTNHGEAALMLAAINDNKEGLITLLKHGANVNARNRDGRTALDFAILCQNPVITRLLKKAGARSEAVGKER